ncbi:Twitchin, partial [Operophtera brumata]
PPKAPSKPAITDYDNVSATLQWEPPVDDGGRPILGYVIEMKDKFAPDWIEVIKTNDTKTEYKVEGLKEKMVYQFRVKAHNKAGVVKPRIERSTFKSIIIKAGRTHKWAVDVTGEPTPETTWSWRDNIKLVNTERIKIENKEYHTDFTIVNAVRRDTGKYTLRAENCNGFDEETVKWEKPEDDGGSPVKEYELEKMDLATGKWVRVGRGVRQAWQREGSRPRQSERGDRVGPAQVGWRRALKPRIDRTNLKPLVVRAGKPIFFDVNVKGEPAPKVQWFQKWKNEEKEVTVGVINVDYNTKLDIKESARSMSGTYRILAENPHGKDEAEVEITVLSSPSKPGGPLKVSDVTKTGCKLAWKKPEDDGDIPGKPSVPTLEDWDVDRVDLKWEAPKDNGGAPITGYVIEKKEKVRAVNKAGPGEPGDATQPHIAKARFCPGSRSRRQDRERRLQHQAADLRDQLEEHRHLHAQG